MKYINLTQGKRVLVDDEDFEWLNQWKWCFHSGGRTDYAMRRGLMDGRHTSIYMHRLILGARKGQVTDHMNGDKLDNRRSNLRFATIAQNAMNKKIHVNNLSGYKGVNKTASGRFTAIICSKHIKTFDTVIQAAKAYDKKAKELFGEFARLNFG